MIYIYGVVREGVSLVPQDGVYGGALERIVKDGFSLVVEPVQASVIEATLGEGARGNEALLHTAVLAHQAVLNALVEQADLLPFRFGTVVDDDDAAQTLISDQRDSFEAVLARVEGHLEWGVKITRAEEKATPEKPASGADYLRQLSAKKNAVSDKQAEISNLCNAVAQCVHDRSRMAQPLPLRSSDARERRLVNFACLLPRGGDEAFKAAVNEAVTGFGDLPVQIEISGPWPPFSFANVTEDSPA
jgi:Gas vesicle synthesis protein GvpL/GvpF